MICPFCNIVMNEQSTVFYSCSKCGRTATINNGGAVSYKENDGTICYPTINNKKKIIDEIEKQIEDWKNDK